MVSRSWGGHTAVLSLTVLPLLAPRALTEGGRYPAPGDFGNVWWNWGHLGLG